MLNDDYAHDDDGDNNDEWTLISTVTVVVFYVQLDLS